MLLTPAKNIQANEGEGAAIPLPPRPTAARLLPEEALLSGPSFPCLETEITSSSHHEPVPMPKLLDEDQVDGNERCMFSYINENREPNLRNPPTIVRLKLRPRFARYIPRNGNANDDHSPYLETPSKKVKVIENLAQSRNVHLIRRASLLGCEAKRPSQSFPRAA